MQQTTAPAEMAAINATSYTTADSSAPAISINDLKPETHCDSLDLETGFSTVPAILLSPASNEGIEIEEETDGSTLTVHNLQLEDQVFKMDLYLNGFLVHILFLCQ